MQDKDCKRNIAGPQGHYARQCSGSMSDNVSVGVWTRHKAN